MDDLAQWLSDKFNSILKWFVDFFLYLLDLIKDLILWVFDAILTAIVTLINAIPLPDFITNGLQTLADSMPPLLSYFLANSGISQAVVIIGAGWAFRLLRKFVTLGQW